MKTPLDYDEFEDAEKNRNYFYLIFVLTLVTFALLKLLLFFTLFLLFGEGDGALMYDKAPYFLIVIIQVISFYFTFQKKWISRKELIFLCFMSLVFFIVNA